MKWTLLALTAIVGMHALQSGRHSYAIADDHLVTKACGTNAECIRRHNIARRTVMGQRWADPTDPLIKWAPSCPTNSWVAFQACYDAARR